LQPGRSSHVSKFNCKKIKQMQQLFAVLIALPAAPTAPYLRRSRAAAGAPRPGEEGASFEVVM
jgi:hypothetical protein